MPNARLVGTDDEGKFMFTALPAGSFSVSATKAGYVPAFFGSKRPARGPGVPVAVADGQRLTVTLKMMPGAVITGTITDPHGTPAPGISVQAFDTRASGPADATLPRATTDDRGVYRIYGLAPGEYVVAAVPRLGPGAGAAVVTDAEVQWAKTQNGPMPAPGRSASYAPIYYPGGTDANTAVGITLAAAEERAGVDLPLRIVTVARVSGTIVDAGGQPVSPATVNLYPRRSDRPSVADRLVASRALELPRATVTPQGFSISGVAPGEYTLVARSGSGMRSAAPPPSSAPQVLWNVTDIAVAEQDLTGIVLRMQPGTKILGTIAFDRSSLTPPEPTRIELTMTSNLLVGAPAFPRAVVDPAGTFKFSSVVPGFYALSATLPVAAAGWSVKSAVLNGRDLADVLFDVKPGDDVTGLVVTFTDRAAAISGRLVDSGGKPITRYSIVVFTTDKTMWLPNARRIRSVAPATDGSFSVTGLPAGTYAIAAAEDVDSADLADPSFLSQLLAAAYTVTLGEGQRITRDLKIGG
jgi:protocatechuate 3,4-dioxygenase beta subunit